MRGWPLYGLVGDRATYNNVPGKLPGWHHLWRLVDEANPLLLIIDPAVASFSGEANSPTQVVMFLDALSSEAGKRRAGTLLTTHSTRASRSEKADPFHPGMVSGTGAWTDHVRGVLTMGEHRRKIPGTGRPERGSQDDEEETILVLRVYKANWGPQRISIQLRAEKRLGHETPIGFNAASPWEFGPAPSVHPRKGHTPSPVPAGRWLRSGWPGRGGSMTSPSTTTTS